MKTCVHCNIEREESAYQQYKGHPNGWCRSCRTKCESDRRRAAGTTERKKWPDLGEGLKMCRSCVRILLLNHFSPSSRGINGVSAYCHACHTLKFKPSKERVRIRTAKYRSAHPARWKAQHRLHQARRRGVIIKYEKIPDVLLQGLYDQPICSYCKKETGPKLRTIDHVIPLHLGGKHEIGNLRMACGSCNSSKQDKELESWLILMGYDKDAT